MARHGTWLVASCLAACTSTAGDSAPGAPGDVTLEAGERAITLRWDVEAGVTYNVYWSLVPGAADADDVIPYADPGETLAGEQPGWVHEGLAPFVTYHYAVTASRDGVESEPSSEVSGQPLPPRVRELSATAGDQEVAISWAPVPGAAAYQIHWSAQEVLDTAEALSVAETEHLQGPLINGTRYFFWVTGLHPEGPGEAAGPVWAVPRLPAPSGISLSPSHDEIRLSWIPLPRALTYNLYGWTDALGEASAEVIAEVIPPFVHAGLQPSTRYSYRIAGDDGLTEGELSEVVFATTLAFSDVEEEPNDAVDDALSIPPQEYPELGASLANPIAAAGGINGTIEPRFDVDWFEVQVETDGRLSVTLVPQGSGADLDVVLTDGTSLYPYGFSYGRTTQRDEHFVAPVYAGNDYFLLVYEFQHSGDSIPYAVTTSFEPVALDPLDNNDSPTTATVRAFSTNLNETLAGTIGHPDDVDWYLLAGDCWTEWDDIEVTLVSPPGVRYDVHFFESNFGDPPEWVDGAVTETPGGVASLWEWWFSWPGDCEYRPYVAVTGGVRRAPGPENDFTELRFFDPNAEYQLTLVVSSWQ